MLPKNNLRIFGKRILISGIFILVFLFSHQALALSGLSMNSLSSAFKSYLTHPSSTPVVVVGNNGSQGSQGPRGWTGSQGPQEIPGPQGVQGPQGLPGPSGNLNSADFVTKDLFDRQVNKIYDSIGNSNDGNDTNVTNSGASLFTDLTDVPSSYAGEAGKAVRVNTAETGLEFFTVPSGGSSQWTTVGSDIYYDLGNVGIGTTTPGAKLEVNNTAVPTGSELVTNGTFTGSAAGWTLGSDVVYNAGTEDVTSTYAGGDSSLSTNFATTAGNTYVITFTVSGANNPVIFYFYNNFLFPASGRFSNGTHTVAFQTNFTGTETVVFDSSSYDLGNTWTIDNVSIKQAKAPIVPAVKVVGLSGDTLLSLGGDTLNNTALGSSALVLNTTGINNTANGAEALSSNTTGVQNTAIGSLSLRSNTTGISNTAVGNSSLSSNTTGSNNTAIGEASLQSNTSGFNNTAIGLISLQLNTTGYGNSAIGNGSLNVNTTGIANTASGENSLGKNTTGNFNSAYGDGSLYFNTTGLNNTAVGVSSLALNSTGSGLVAIGYNAGRYELGSNAFYVNNVDQTSTAGDKAYSLLYGTFAGVAGSLTGQQLVINGNVGIGTSTPRTELELGGDGAILATGTFGSGWTEPGLGSGTRMLWYPQQAAFRAGFVNSTEWDFGNIGNYSTATGFSTTASGSYSTALGVSTIASGEASLATGIETTASGAGGPTAMGLGTVANSYNSFALGRFNVGGGNPTSWVDTDPLFEIGIGANSGAKADAVTVLKNGEMGIGVLAAATGNHICYDTTSISGMNTFATCSSLRELKTDIVPLTVGISDLMQLNPVSFTDKASGEHRFGFIAQDVNAVNPTLSSYYKGQLNGVDYDAVTSLTVKSIQELNLNLAAISGTVTPIPGSTAETFVTAFFDNLFEKITEWLASAGNRIAKIFTTEIDTKNLCVSDESGEKTCITKLQLDALLHDAGNNNSHSSDSEDETPSPLSPLDPVSTTEPSTPETPVDSTSQ